MPTATLRPDLEALPVRLRSLRVDERGYPVPWFVAWVDGKPEFRAADAQKLRDAVLHSLCWVCGERLGRFKTFVVGPMCGINRTSAEPPCHLDCAEWSARNCPFLKNGRRPRREDDTFNAQTLADHSPGFALNRNPGVALLWTTRDFRTFRPDARGILFKLGEPAAVRFYACGRPATRAEVLASVESGLPHLKEMAALDGVEGEMELAAACHRFRLLLPTE